MATRDSAVGSSTNSRAASGANATPIRANIRIPDTASGWWASGFLLKGVDPPDLVHARRTVVRDEALLAPAITRRLIERFLATPPPGRPITRILAKLGLRDRVHAVVLGYESGLVRPGDGA